MSVVLPRWDWRTLEVKGLEGAILLSPTRRSLVDFLAGYSGRKNVLRAVWVVGLDCCLRKHYSRQAGCYLLATIGVVL